MPSIPPNDPADLRVLEAFLDSDQTQDDCMTLSELDGFLAGIIVGPELVMPSEWLPCIWGEDEPVFKDQDQANAVLGNIMRRYNDIIEQLKVMPPAYHPILSTTEDGKVDGSDWAVGFVAAIALRQDGWERLVSDPEAGMLLAPIMLVASTTSKAHLPLDDDEMLPPEEMAKLLAEPRDLLGLCTAGIQMFFEGARGKPPRRWPRPAKKQKKRMSGKRHRRH